MSPPRIGFIGLGRMGRPMAFTGDLGNVIEATSIGGRRRDFFLQQSRAIWDFCNNIGTKAKC